MVEAIDGAPASPPAAAAEPLFGRLPETLFSPLASANRRVYAALLIDLYPLFFDQIHADLFPSRETVRAEIEERLIVRTLVLVEEGEYEPGDGAPAARAYRRLRDAGWFAEEHEGFRVQVTVPPASASRSSTGCASWRSTSSAGAPWSPATWGRAARRMRRRRGRRSAGTSTACAAPSSRWTVTSNGSTVTVPRWSTGSADTVRYLDRAQPGMSARLVRLCRGLAPRVSGLADEDDAPLPLIDTASLGAASLFEPRRVRRPPEPRPLRSRIADPAVRERQVLAAPDEKYGQIAEHVDTIVNVDRDGGEVYIDTDRIKPAARGGAGRRQPGPSGVRWRGTVTTEGVGATRPPDLP
ncbi:Wadjet anti-phage system protein JetA family protein [Endothiovibrio diazotrophicus]